MSSLSKPLLHCCAVRFDVTLHSEERQTCFPKVLSYCCDIPGGKDVSAVRHGEGNLISFVNRHLEYEDGIISEIGVAKYKEAPTIATRRKVEGQKKQPSWPGVRTPRSAAMHLQL